MAATTHLGTILVFYSCFVICNAAYQWSLCVHMCFCGAARCDAGMRDQLNTSCMNAHQKFELGDCALQPFAQLYHHLLGFCARLVWYLIETWHVPRGTCSAVTQCDEHHGAHCWCSVVGSSSLSVDWLVAYKLLLMYIGL